MAHYSPDHARRRAAAARFRSGQAAVFLLAALVVLVAVLLWDADLHSLVAGKSKARNAGDAAALAAARWQANTLNLVGDLNLAHLAALDAGDHAAVASITSMQARLCFAGPMTALAAAQAAAKKNGVPPSPGLSSLLREHAATAMGYAESVAGESAIPEPYPGAWLDYGEALFSIADAGVAAAPDNARFFGDPDGGHILLDKAFYEAVAGREWCWFFLYCQSGGNRTILDDFTGHSWFPPLPPPPRDASRYANSEIFGLGLQPRRTALARFGALADRLLSSGAATAKSLAVEDVWYFYSPSLWYSPWPGMTDGREDSLPLAGPVREEYDYAGADAVARLYAPVPLLSFGAGDGETNMVAWTAAAKPFGFIAEADGERRTPIAFGLVLPAYRSVRLVPIDAATGGGDGSFDIDWSRHTREHLPPYLDTGELDGACRYCRLISTFEDPDFRRGGSEWLSENSYKCTLPSYGRGRGGGSRRGH